MATTRRDFSFTTINLKLRIPKNLTESSHQLARWICSTDFFNKKIYGDDYTGTPLSSRAMQSAVRDENYKRILDSLVDDGIIKQTTSAIWKIRCAEYTTVSDEWVSVDATDEDTKFAAVMDKQLGGKRKQRTSETIKSLCIPDNSPEWAKDMVKDGTVSVDSNGRQWSAICSLPKKIREGITHNGTGLVEVDVSSSHIRLLAKHYKDRMPEDEYKLLIDMINGGFYWAAVDALGLPRNEKTKKKSKDAFFNVLNGKRNWFTAITTSDVNTPLMMWRMIIETFFPTLRHLISKDRWDNDYKFIANLLQKKEAELITKIQETMGSRVKYTVYDSVAVLPCYVKQVEALIDTLWSIDSHQSQPTIGYTGNTKMGDMFAKIKERIHSGAKIVADYTKRTFFRRKKSKQIYEKPIKQMTVFSFT